MINNRVFTEEDKKLRPKVYIQDINPTTSDDNILFKVSSEEVVDGVTNTQASLVYTKDGQPRKLNVQTRSDMVTMKDSNQTLDDVLNNLDGETIEEVLLAANWVTDIDVPYIYTLTYTIDIEKDVEVYLNSSDATIIEQCAKANIISGRHNQTTIELIAYGEKPTVNIPIKLVIVKRIDPNVPQTFSLNPATTEELGGIKEGSGVEIKDSTLTLEDIQSLLDELSNVSN